MLPDRQIEVRQDVEDHPRPREPMRPVRLKNGAFRTAYSTPSPATVNMGRALPSTTTISARTVASDRLPPIRPREVAEHKERHRQGRWLPPAAGNEIKEPNDPSRRRLLLAERDR